MQLSLSCILPLFVGSAAAGILASSASPAQAFLVTVNGTNYNVSTVESSFDQNSSLLQQQVWWNNETLADQFALEVGGNLGFPNRTFFLNLGPSFAFNQQSLFSDTLLVVESKQVPEGSLGGETFFRRAESIINGTFAIATEATPTPIPDRSGGIAIPTVGSIFALALMRKARKR